jgi:hypothetical protein
MEGVGPECVYACIKLYGGGGGNVRVRGAEEIVEPCVDTECKQFGKLVPIRE